MNLKKKLKCGLPEDKEELKKLLSAEQYQIMVESGTEAPFHNAYWDHFEKGIYVDAISGVPLFSSEDKFHSKSGWPSFRKPIHPDAVTEHQDLSHGMSRIEVRSASSDAHLGHVFPDGPAPTGLRYCVNSLSLRFVPHSELP